MATGQYEEAERRLGELLKSPDLGPSSLVGLRILEIINALAMKKAAAVPQKLKELRAFVSGQSEDFHAGWTFDGTNDGTKHYVQTKQVFSRYRTWLNDLFSIVEAKDRATFLSAMDRVESSFAR